MGAGKKVPHFDFSSPNPQVYAALYTPERLAGFQSPSCIQPFAIPWTAVC